MEGILNSFRKIDAYPKVNEDFFQRSISGGVITIVSSIIMLCLFISELSESSDQAHSFGDVCSIMHTADPCPAAGLFMTVTTTNELSVDTSRGDQLQIHVRSIAGPKVTAAPPVILVDASDVTDLMSDQLHTF